MPLGFSGGANLLAMGERYGDKLADSIVQTGKVIEQSLQRVTTQRQLAGLGASLSTLDPQTPDYPQKLIALGSEYPFAMQDPRGQALMMIGAKSHAQWQQTQAVAQRQQVGFGNQVALENLRDRHIRQRAAERPNNEMDLSAFANGLPRRNVPLPSLDPAANEPVTDEQAPLYGTREDLGSIASRALGPLAEAQQITGSKPNKSQVFSAIAGERTRLQQEKMQEDRQAAAAAAAATRDEIKAKTEEARAQRTETTLNKTLLQSQLSSAKSDVTRLSGELDKHLATRKSLDKTLNALNEEGKHKEAEDTLKEWEGEKAKRQRDLQEAGAERTRLLSELEKLGTKELDAETAAALLKEAGGDKAKARALARERGFHF